MDRRIGNEPCKAGALLVEAIGGGTPPFQPGLSFLSDLICYLLLSVANGCESEGDFFLPRIP